MLIEVKLFLLELYIIRTDIYYLGDIQWYSSYKHINYYFSKSGNYWYNSDCVYTFII